MILYFRANLANEFLGVVTFCGQDCHAAWGDGEDEFPRGRDAGKKDTKGKLDDPRWCAVCGMFAGATPECEHQLGLEINRIPCESGEICECGNWLQMPTDMLPR